MFDSFETKVRKLTETERYYKIRSMHQKGKPVVPELQSLLYDDEAYIRANAADALSWIGLMDTESVKPAIPRFIELLDDEDSSVCASACKALQWLAMYYPQTLVPAVPRLRALLHDTHWGVRYYATGIIADIAEKYPEKVEPAIPRLTELLDDISVRDPAVKAVALIAKKYPEKVETATSKLIKLLNDEDNDEDSDVRGYAAFALGNIGAVDALELLERLCRNDSYVRMGGEYITVGQVAKEALEKIRTKKQLIENQKKELTTMIDEALEEKESDR